MRTRTGAVREKSRCYGRMRWPLIAPERRDTEECLPWCRWWRAHHHPREDSSKPDGRECARDRGDAHAAVDRGTVVVVRAALSGQAAFVQLESHQPDMRQPLLRIFLQAAAQQRLYVRRRVRRQRAPVGFTREDVRDRIRDRLPGIERLRAGEHLEQHAAECPDVHAADPPACRAPVPGSCTREYRG